jgi:hypothetical protein
MGTGVSEKSPESILKVLKRMFSGCYQEDLVVLCPEDGVNRFIRNVGTYVPKIQRHTPKDSNICTAGTVSNVTQQAYLEYKRGL